MDKERWFAFVIILLIIPTIAVPVNERWVTDTTALATEIVSGLVVAMICVSVALWYRGGKKQGEKQSNEPKLEAESDVIWHLSGDILSVPPFGSQDMIGSNKASKLHVSQRDKTITLTGKMRKLKPSYTYAVYLGKPFRPFSIGETGPNPTIGAQGAPYRAFTTDKQGNGNWDRVVTVNELTRYGIVDRFRVLVNDGPKDKTVLISEDISMAI